MSAEVGIAITVILAYTVFFVVIGLLTEDDK